MEIFFVTLTQVVHIADMNKSIMNDTDITK